MNIKVLYPGRFQPMGRHHFKSYVHLTRQFGSANVYIVTSDDRTPPKSPFTFKQKQQIANEYGVPKNRFVQVKSPYRAIELVSTFPKDTVLIFAVGAKDMKEDPRFTVGKLKSGKDSYFQLYADNMSNLRPYTEHGYLYVLPHVEIKIPKFGEMSGTALRSVLATADIADFTDIMGWFDNATYKMIKTVLGSVTESVAIKEIITEGGAGGHMQHPYDNLDLTFEDLHSIIERTLSGKLNIEKDVSEKTDGQNLQVTYKDGKIKAARNKSQLITPIDSDAIKMKFAGRGDIEKAFSLAMDDLESAFTSLPQNQLEEIFHNGSRFINLEIIYPATKNVINYGATAFLQFHGLVEYDSLGRVVDTFPEFGTKLYNIINKVNVSVQKTFKIIPPNIIQLKQVEHLDDRMNYYKQKLSKLQAMYNLSDSDTLFSWHTNFWTNFLQKYVANLDPEKIQYIVQRWVYGNKSFRLDSSNIPDRDTLDTLIELESTIVPKQVKINTAKFEEVFLQLGTEILKSIRTMLTLNPDIATKEIRAALAATINSVISSGDVKSLDKVKEQLKRLKTVGGVDSIVPIEGIVFTYKGRPYKLTGSFASANQIIGLLKFAR